MIYFKDENLTIRCMRDSDIKEIVYGFNSQGWSRDEDSLLKYYKEQAEGKREVLIAEKDGYIVGYVTLLPETKEGPFSNKGIPEVVDFNVFIKYQRNGIGSKLMDNVEKLAKEKSNIISLAVGLHYGYGTAQRMYVKRGYIPDGSGAWYQNQQLEQYTKCENDDDLVLYMSKTL
ncbi:MAG: GNAT family N-acetyltransferase [Paraclostridium sp.]